MKDILWRISFFHTKRFRNIPHRPSNETYILTDT
jgi:hypothetical protein